MNTDSTSDLPLQRFHSSIDKVLLPELLVMIMEYLPIRDLVKCGTVCRTFRHLVGQVKIRDLVINEDSNQRRLGNTWFYANTPFDKASIVNCALNSILNYGLKLHRLHRLCIINSGSLTKRSIVNLVNNLEKLKHLELTINRDKNEDDQIVLNLPSLETFRLFAIKDKFTINSSMLKAVYLYAGPNEIRFNNPELIEHLEIKIADLFDFHHHPFNQYVMNLNMFHNVRTLRFSAMQCYIDLSQFFINQLSRLNEMYIDLSNANHYIPERQMFTFRYIPAIKEMQDRANLIHDRNLKIFVENEPI